MDYINLLKAKSLEEISQSLRFELPTIFTDRLSEYNITGKYYLIHYHEILYSFIFYNLLFFVCPLVGKLLFGKNYTEIKNKKLKMNFDIHLIAFFQCILSILICIPLLVKNYSLNVDASDFEMLESYDYRFSFVSAITIGYFLWDSLICLKYFDLFGFEFLLHAFASLFVFSITLLPFFQYWIPRFLMFELSSPFVNINWFISKLPKESVSLRFNAFNGICLLVTFFTVRIGWGFTAIALVIKQLYSSWDKLSTLKKTISFIVVFLNLNLDILNLFWFSKMVRIAKKMLFGSSTKAKKD